MASLELRAVLSGAVEFHSMESHPTWNTNHAFVLRIHTVCATFTLVTRLPDLLLQYHRVCAQGDPL